jgi:hypothetical protein
VYGVVVQPGSISHCLSSCDECGVEGDEGGGPAWVAARSSKRLIERSLQRWRLVSKAVVEGRRGR